MIHLTLLLVVVGLAVELAGLLGTGLSWFFTGAALTLVGGVLWGLGGDTPSAGWGRLLKPPPMTALHLAAAQPTAFTP